MPSSNVSALISILCFGASVAPALVGEIRHDVIANRTTLLLFAAGVAFNVFASPANWSCQSLSGALIFVPIVLVLVLPFHLTGGLNAGSAEFLMALAGWFPGLDDGVVIALGLSAPALLCLVLRLTACPVTPPMGDRRRPRPAVRPRAGRPDLRTRQPRKAASADQVSEDLVPLYVLGSLQRRARQDAMSAPAQPRYTAAAQALHWLTALLLAAALPLAWVGTSLAREAPAKGPVFVLHKSVGLTILALVVVRILWRHFHPAPPEPLPRGLALIARLNHWLLYAILLVMPVSGYLLSALAGRSTPYFWLFTVPGLTENSDLQKVFAGVHLAGQWAVYLLVALHLAGAVWHVAIRRDGVLDRMLPPQDRRASP